MKLNEKEAEDQLKEEKLRTYSTIKAEEINSI